jgi:hypothetical protein
MADLEVFVSTSGVDKAGNGTAAKPFRTIQNAAKNLAGRLAAGQAGKIFVEPGTYEEVIVLTDGMQLLRKDSLDQVTVDIEKELYLEQSPAVHIKRPSPASAPQQSSSSPTWSEVVKIHGKNVVIQGVRVEGEHRPQRVMLIHDSENVSLTGCMITGGSSQILYTGKGTGTPTDPFRSKVTDEGEGAGIRILRSKKVTLKNCVFDDNRTDLKFIQEVTEDDISKLESSTEFRVAVGLHKIDKAEVEKLLRQPVPVRDGGGHVSCFDADEITFETCFFENGFSGGRGGALQFAHNAYGGCVSCLFRKNEAKVDGGAVCFNDPDPDFFTRKRISFTGCKFKNNTSGDDGGAVYLTTNARAGFKDCIFESNKADSNGGAMRATFGSFVSLENCRFSFNQANLDAATRVKKNQDGGGAIAVNNSSLFMKGGKIESNTVTGFAGGGIYFITAAYGKQAEKVAELTHGHTFDNIFKKGYGVNSVQLRVTDVTFFNNTASGETCNVEVCSLSPRTGFEPRGAGGAIYVLESTEDFNVPVTVQLENVKFVENLSAHKEDKQKADLVVRNVTKLVSKGGALMMHPSNKFAASFIDVHDGDVSGSPQFRTRKSEGKIFESGSNMQY